MALESFEFKWEIKMVMAWMEESLEIRIGAVADSASNFAFKVQYYTLLACQFLTSNMWSTTYFPISCWGLVTKIALLQYSKEDMLLKLKNLNTPYEDMY